MLNFSHLKNKLIWISIFGAILLIVGNYLPIIEINSGTLDYAKTFSFIPYEGKYIVLVAALALILFILNESKYAICSAIVSTIFILYLVLNKSNLYDDCVFYESMFSWGYGLYVLCVGNILLYVFPIIEIVKEKFTIRTKK